MFLFYSNDIFLRKKTHKYDKYGIQSDDCLLGEGGGVVIVRGLGVGGGEAGAAELVHQVLLLWL